MFQPDAPYQTGTDTSFYKWKWMDTVTVDIAITPQPYKVRLSPGEHAGEAGGGLPPIHVPSLTLLLSLPSPPQVTCGAPGGGGLDLSKQVGATDGGIPPTVCLVGLVGT